MNDEGVLRMLVGGMAGGLMVGLWMVMVGVLYSINTDLGNLLLRRKFNSKTPNIYIANIVNKIGLLWNSFPKVPHTCTWRVSRLEGCNDYRRRVAAWCWCLEEIRLFVGQTGHIV